MVHLGLAGFTSSMPAFPQTSWVANPGIPWGGAMLLMRFKQYFQSCMIVTLLFSVNPDAAFAVTALEACPLFKPEEDDLG